jgi:hypothetical protein
MMCCRAYVLPVLLFSNATTLSETWALNKKQAKRLEVVHLNRLAQTSNVHRTDRHSKQHLWS